jgi:lipopolysaccharide export system permease protein
MIIYRYLTKEIGSILIATTGVLLLIFMSTQFIHFMRSAAAGNLTAHTVLILLALEVPILLGTLLPLALFLGILLAFGRMYADSEMTVLFASGVSQGKLVKITMSIATIVMIIVAALMLWISPYTDRYAKSFLASGALSPIELILPGTFRSFQDDRWIFYAEEITSDHKHLKNIFVAEHDDSNKQQANNTWSVISAHSGEQKIDKKTGDSFLVLDNGKRYSGVPGQKNYQVINFDQYWTRIIQTQDKQNVKESSIPTSILWQKSDQDNRADAELQWRLSVPIMVMILALMGVPLSRVKTRQGRYAQLVPAMLLYIIYGNFLFLGRSWLKSGVLSHDFGMWWIHGIMLLIAIFLITQQIGWQRIIKVFSK